jgi:outer membrane protein insertion porin family
VGTRIRISLAALCLWLAVAGDARAHPRELAAARRTPPVEPAPPPPAPPAPPEPAPKVERLVGSVELHLPKDADTKGLAELVALRPGTPLKRNDVQRTLERLYGTGRFSDIVISAVPDARGRLSVVIEADTRTFVDSIEFEGNAVLTEAALRKALALTDRRPEYYLEFIDRLQARLASAYRRIGYTRAQVKHVLVQGDAGEAVLRFQILEREPTRITAVEAAGDPQMPVAEIVKTLGLSQGDVLDLDKLDKGIAALKARFRSEGHYRARFGPPQVTEEGPGALLRLPITAGPALQFVFRGNDAFDDRALLHRLAYDPQEPLDETLQGQLEERLVAFYRINGFADARVRSREVRGWDRKTNYIVFHVHEGAPLRVVSLTFAGNEHFDERFLKERVVESLVEAFGEGEADIGKPDELFAGGPARRARWAPDPAAVYYEPAYQQALARIVELYRADGYLSAFAAPPLVERDELSREAKVTLGVKEGVQTLISEVAFAGAPSPDKLAALVSVRPGKPFNSLEVENSRQAIQLALGREGHVFAKVEDEEPVFSGDRHSAKISFRIWLGPKVRVGRILVQGLNRTSESVVRWSLSVAEGRLLDPEQLAQSQRSLAKLGIFRTVSIRMNSPEVPEEIKDLYVTAEERGTQTIGLGGGYSLVDGPRLLAEYSKINLFGVALQLQARAKVNYFDWNYQKLADTSTQLCANLPLQGKHRQDLCLDALGRHLNLSLLYPRVPFFLPVEAGGRLDVLNENVVRPSYKFERTAALFGADMSPIHGVGASIAYEIASVGVNHNPGTATVELSRSDTLNLRFAEGTILLHSIRPTLSYDLRDDPANPHKGLLLGVTAEFVQSLGGQFRNPDRPPHSLFIKGSFQASGYVPVWRGIVLAVSLRGGMVFPLASNSETIVPYRFFLGGASSMRGFLDDGMVPEDQRQALRAQVAQCDATLNKTGCSAGAVLVRQGSTLLSSGGEAFTLARAELRFPVAGSLEGALFFDAGNLWLDTKGFDLFRLRYATGAGLRLVTPIGPAALDLGINLAPDRVLNEAMFIPHFSIGLF